MQEKKKDFFDEEDQFIDPAEIWEELAKAFPSKFPLNEKSDASECFDDVLTMIQNNLVPPEMREK